MAAQPNWNDAMPGLGQILIILIIIGIIFGIGRLPNAMGQLGSAIGRFRDVLKDDKKEDEGEDGSREEAQKPVLHLESRRSDSDLTPTGRNDEQPERK